VRPLLGTISRSAKLEERLARARTACSNPGTSIEKTFARTRLPCRVEPMLYLLIAVLYGFIGLSAPLLIVWWFSRNQRPATRPTMPLRRMRAVRFRRAFTATPLLCNTAKRVSKSGSPALASSVPTNSLEMEERIQPSVSADSGAASAHA
jgi:hypothetical protein